MSKFIRPLSDWQHQHMAFELAALHGEMYRIYQRVENNAGKTGDNHLSELVGTTGDRMVHALLLVSVAALPLLSEISEAYHDGDQPGVFTYDHIEMSRAELKNWKNSSTLPAHLFNNLSSSFWLQAAENNQVDLDALNGHINSWALENIGAWAQRHFQDEPGVQRQGGAEEWAPDEELTADQLRQKYTPVGEHEDYVRQMWRHEVLELNVISGYWDWVFNSIQEARPDPKQCNKLLHSYMSKDPSRCVNLTQVRPGVFKTQRGEDEVTSELIVASIQFGHWLAQSLTCDGYVELA